MPLLYKKELYQSGFLLNALTNERIAMTKFLLSIDPSKLYQSICGKKTKGNIGTWPIHIAVNTYGTNDCENKPSFKLFQYLLQQGMKHRSMLVKKGMESWDLHIIYYPIFNYVLHFYIYKCHKLQLERKISPIAIVFLCIF